MPAAGDIAVQAPRFGLHADHFGARNGQGVGVALLLQPEPQVGAVSVDGIGDHLADRQASRLRSWHHAQSQFRFGLKGDGLREVSGSPAREIVAPVFGQIPFAVDQGMAVNGPKFKEVVEAALDRGNLRVARADGALSIAAGQMRLSTTIMRGEGAGRSAWRACESRYAGLTSQRLAPGGCAALPLTRT